MDKDVLVRQLNEGMKTLSFNEKVILQLWYYEELTLDEICIVMDMDMGSVGIELSMAKTKMRMFTTIFDDIDKFGQKGLNMVRKYHQRV